MTNTPADKPAEKMSVQEMIQSGNLLRKKKSPKTSANRFEVAWRAALEELQGRQAKPFTGKQMGQAKMIVTALATLRPDLTEQKMQEDVRRFGQWCVLAWQDVADHLKSRTTSKVPGAPSIGHVLMYLDLVYALYAETRFALKTTAKPEAKPEDPPMPEPKQLPPEQAKTEPTPPEADKITQEQWDQIFGDED